MMMDWHEVIRVAPPIRGVIHIGAHRAEERHHYLLVGITKIIWIEANPKLASWLQTQVNEPVFNYAICDQDCAKLAFHLSTNDGESSSILWPKEHIWKHPSVGFGQTIIVPAITLDTLIAEQHIAVKDYNFINIDIQGAELLALQGMATTLPHIDAIYAEINFIEMYEGCGLVAELDAHLAGYGFQRRMTYDTGLGWGDALYIKPKPPGGGSDLLRSIC